MAVHDSFDPLMFLSQTKAKTQEAGQTSTADTGASAIPEKHSGTEQIRSAANTKHNTEIPRGGGAQQRQPSGVQTFTSDRV